MTTSARLPRGLELRLASMMALSGCAALIYETVWLRMLSRAFGVTVHAVSALVALYFAGLVLGSLAAARWTLREGRWLRVYALLEALACAASLLASFWMAHLPQLVAKLAPGYGLGLGFETMLRFSLAGPVLILPTFFLGATLPVLARFRTGALSDVQKTVGRLYGSNTCGAAAGTLLAGFWFLGEYGETGTLIVGAALNLSAAALAWFSPEARQIIAAAKKGADRSVDPSLGRSTQPFHQSRLLLLLFGVSGFCALGYEILWTRQLVLLIGNSSYAFSLLLATYLLGNSLGSFLSRQDASGREGWELFGRLELVLAATALIGLAAFGLLGLRLDHPDYLYSTLRGGSDLARLAVCAAALVLPASVAMGLLFPVVARLATPEARFSGTAAGLAYAVNTAGSIAGSLVVGFAGLRLLGAQGAYLALASLNAAAGLAALVRAGALRPGSAGAGPNLILAGLVLASAGFAARDRAPEIIARRIERGKREESRLLFYDEAPAGTVTGLASGEGKYLFINGILTSTLGINGALMVSLPNLFLERPRRTLVICVGVGTTLWTADLLGGEVHAVDLLDGVLRHVGEFHPDLPAKLRGPQRRTFVDDGRNYLLRNREAYDVVVVDATPPLYSAGTVNLYTSEFLALAKDRLSPEGVFSLWLPTRSFEEDYWAILRSMADTFEHVAVWNHKGVKHGFLIFGSRRPFEWPAGLLDRRIQERLPSGFLQGMREADLRAGFRLTEGETRAHAAGFAPVTDDRPYTEFPLKRFLRGEAAVQDSEFLLSAQGAKLPGRDR